MTDIVQRDEIERLLAAAIAENEQLRRDLEIWKRNGGDILLQAEIERLQDENELLHDEKGCRILDMQDEIGQLQADIKRWKNTAAAEADGNEANRLGWEKADAENERLKDEIRRYRIVVKLPEIEMVAEIERLRNENKTLQLLVDGEFGFAPSTQKGS